MSSSKEIIEFTRTEYEKARREGTLVSCVTSETDDKAKAMAVFHNIFVERLLFTEGQGGWGNIRTIRVVEGDIKGIPTFKFTHYERPNRVRRKWGAKYPSMQMKRKTRWSDASPPPAEDQQE